MIDPINSLDINALQAIGLDSGVRQQWLEALAGPQTLESPEPPATAARPMRVVEIQRTGPVLHDGRHTRPARVPPPLARALDDDGDALAVGDWVLAWPDAHDAWTVWQRLPRRTSLTRRVSDERGGLVRQVLVSNVDRALLVMGLDHDFNLRRLERYLALVQSARVAPVLVLSKADQVGPLACGRHFEQARGLLPSDVPVLALDGRDPGAAKALSPWLLTGHTLVLLGSSGAGKSTLCNSLLGAGNAAGQRTGGVRTGDDRGRHTTTVRSLLPLPGGACIIDTPGLRALRLDIGDESELAGTFGEVARFAEACRFRNCRHTGEPGCAVREAMPQERLSNYHKLLREARRDQLTVLERREQLGAWKARRRAGRAARQEREGGAPGDG